MLQVPYHRAAPQHHDEARRMEPLCETHDAQAELGHQRQPGETDLRIRGLRPDRAERQEPEGLFPRIERRGNREAEEVANRKPPCHALQRNGSGPGVFRPQYPVPHRLPMTGKTSLFTILTGVHQETHIGSTAVRTGVAKVPDARLEELGRLFDPPKVTHATVEYVDMPSVSKESLRDPSYLASLRVVDAFAHVLRLFEDATVAHEKGSVDPVRDLEDVEMELMLSDLLVIEKRLERLDKDRKKIKNPELDREFELLEKCKAT